MFLKTVDHRYEIVSSRLPSLMPMFNPVFRLTQDPVIRDDINKTIKVWNSVFKKHDQIIWALKRLRDSELYYLNKNTEADINSLSKEQKVDLKNLETAHKEANYIKQNIERFKHFIGTAVLNNYKSMLDFKFTNDMTPQSILEKLRSLEELEQSKTKDKDRLLEPDESQSDFLKFKDGWKWVLVNKATCKREGKAMNHCGNAAAKHGDQILSLREPVKHEGKKLEHPHLTFIVNRGVLGEMKGFSNNKPSKKFHKYIIPLLKDARIETIRGGGYAPENNFDLEDLTPEAGESLLKEKPSLSLDNFIQNAPPEKMLALFGNELTADGRYIILDRHDNIDAFIAKNKWAPLEPQENLYHIDHIDKSQQEHLLVLFMEKKEKEFHKVFTTLVKRDPELFKTKGVDPKDPTFGLKDFKKEAPAIILDLFHDGDLDDDLITSINSSILDGWQASAETSWIKNYRKFLENVETDTEVSLFWEDPEQWFDSKVFSVVSLDTFKKNLKYILEEDNDEYFDETGLWSYFLRNSYLPEFNWNGDVDFDDNFALDNLAEHHLSWGDLI